MYTACLLFPNGEAAKVLATRLLQVSWRVLFYCPEEEDVKAAASIIAEMKILACEVEIDPDVEMFGILTGPDFRSIDVLGNVVFLMNLPS